MIFTYYINNDPIFGETIIQHSLSILSTTIHPINRSINNSTTSFINNKKFYGRNQFISPSRDKD